MRERAIRFLRLNSLWAAEAFQLAAALVACSEQPGGREFFTAHARLAEAARAEGFRVG